MCSVWSCCEDSYNLSSISIHGNTWLWLVDRDSMGMLWSFGIASDNNSHIIDIGYGDHSHTSVLVTFSQNRWWTGLHVSSSEHWTRWVPYCPLQNSECLRTNLLTSTWHIRMGWSAWLRDFELWKKNLEQSLFFSLLFVFIAGSLDFQSLCAVWFDTAISRYLGVCENVIAVWLHLLTGCVQTSVMLGVLAAITCMKEAVSIKQMLLWLHISMCALACSFVAYAAHSSQICWSASHAWRGEDPESGLFLRNLIWLSNYHFLFVKPQVWPWIWPPQYFFFTQKCTKLGMLALRA